MGLYKGALVKNIVNYFYVRAPSRKGVKMVNFRYEGALIQWGQSLGAYPDAGPESIQDTHPSTARAAEATMLKTAAVDRPSISRTWRVVIMNLNQNLQILSEQHRIQ